MGSFKFNVDDAFTDEYNRGRGIGMSPETARQCELEMKQLVDDCLKNVEALLLAKRKELDQLAHALVEKETLFYRDLVAILEPHRSDADVEREIATLADRKLVGKRREISFDLVAGLGLFGGNGGNGVTSGSETGTGGPVGEGPLSGGTTPENNRSNEDEAK
jgi:hypothetical protein